VGGRSSLGDVDGERAARYVVGAPANDQCVVALLRRRVRHLVGGRTLLLDREVVHQVPGWRHHSQRQQRLTCRHRRHHVATRNHKVIWKQAAPPEWLMPHSLPIRYDWSARYLPLNRPFPRGRSACTPSNSRFSGPTRPSTPNGIRIQ